LSGYASYLSSLQDRRPDFRWSRIVNPVTGRDLTQSV